MLKKLENTFRGESSYRQFFLSLLVTAIGYGCYKGVLDNYLAEIVTMSEFDRGVAEFFREIPGLLMVFILAVLYTFSAEKLYKLGAVIIMVGLAMITVVPAERVMVTVAICVYSLGEHIQLGMRNTLTLEYAKPGKSGTALGMQSSVNQIGTLFGYLLVVPVFLAVSGMLVFRGFFLAATVLAAVGMVLALGIRGSSETDKARSRFYFRKKYTKYYFLEVFYGARKQVFLTFGPYVLILFYGAGANTISLLFAVSAVCCYFAAPWMGKLIDRLGYRTIMIADTLVLVIVCLLYGYAHHIFPREIAFFVCCVNYILDAVISLGSMASNVYVQDISDSTEEVRATIFTGISVNHLITIFIALFGGWVWKTMGIEELFTLSAVLGVCNSIYAATIKPKGVGKTIR